MQTLAALRLMVTHYPLGIEAMALEVGKSPKTLRKELDGTSTTHKLSVLTADMISAACIRAKSPHCRAYANSIASECGGRVELNGADSDQETHDPCTRFSSVIRETSDVAIAWTEGMADSKLNDNELERIEKEITEAERALQNMRQCARAVHAASKPVQLRAAA